MLLNSNNQTQKTMLRVGNNSLGLKMEITNRDQVFTIWGIIQMLEVSKIVFSNNNNSNQITVIHKCILWTFRTKPLRRHKFKILLVTNPQNLLKLEMASSFWIRVVSNINNSKSLLLKAQIHQNQDLFLYNKRDPLNQEELAQQLFLKKRLIESIHKMSIIRRIKVDNQVTRIKTCLISSKRRWRRDMKVQGVDVKLWMLLGSHKVSLCRMLQALEPKNIAHKWLPFRMVQCQLWLVEELAVLTWTILVHISFLISHNKMLEVQVAK